MIRYITLRQAETTFFTDSLGFKRHLPNRIRLFVSLIDAPTGQININTHQFNKENETGRAGLHAINYAPSQLFRPSRKQTNKHCQNETH